MKRLQQIIIGVGISIRQHTSESVSILQYPSVSASIRQHTSAYVSVRAHLLDDEEAPADNHLRWDHHPLVLVYKHQGQSEAPAV